MLFDADSRVFDAPFVGSAEDLWFVVRLGRAFGCVLDLGDGTGVPDELSHAALFNGRTWADMWY